MNEQCDPYDHAYNPHRERDLLWCAKCGTTKNLDESKTGMVFNVTDAADFVSKQRGSLA